jgi:pimeloyl-ACP methyl ester carboxylesterase
MSTAQVNSITIGYQDTGDGAPLVLVHGHPFDRSMWQPQAEHFARSGWRVIVPDLRGYGESTVVPGATTMETFATDIAALLDHLAVDRIVLGGLSMGGQIVMEFCRLFPHRVRALVFADTSPRADTEEVRQGRFELADRLSRTGMAGYADEVLPRMVAPSTVERRPAVTRHVLSMMRDAPVEGAAAALRGRAARRDYVESLGRIGVPALVVVGRDDGYTPVEDAELIRARIPDATLAIVEDAGHLPNLERPDEFNAALAGFLDSVAVRATA